MRTAPERNTGIDAIRLLAVCGIVWFHAHAPGWRFAYAGLPILLLMSFALPVSRGADRPLVDQTKRRASRLLVPWLFWSAVYALPIALQAIRSHSAPNLAPSMLLAGTSFHLWYLPFAFVGSLAAVMLARALNPLPEWLAVALSSIAGGALVYWSDREMGLPEPWSQHVFAAPSILLGLSLGIAMRSQRRQMMLLAWVCGTAAMLPAWNQHYLIGYAVICLILAVPMPGSRVIAAAAPLALGIYLIHPAILTVSKKVCPVCELGTIWLAALMLLASATLTAVLLRTPLRRFVV